MDIDTLINSILYHGASGESRHLLSSAMHTVEREARLDERATCARIARDYARALSKGTHPKAGSTEEIGERIAAAIEIPF